MTFAEHGLSVCHSCCRLVLNFIFPVFGFRFSLKKEIENSAHKTLARKHSAKKNSSPNAFHWISCHSDTVFQVHQILQNDHLLVLVCHVNLWPLPLQLLPLLLAPSPWTMPVRIAEKKHPTKMSFPITNARLDPKMNWRAHLCFCKCCWISF